MSLKEDLIAARARVEQATGPDRILDAMLEADIAGRCLHGSWHSEGPDGDRGRVCDDCGADSWGNLGKFGQRLNGPVPAFTASIDAALGLVERKLPGYRWGVSATGIKRGTHPDGKPAYIDGFRAHVTKNSPLRPMPSVADAPTAPLAILAALLSAIESAS